MSIQLLDKTRKINQLLHNNNSNRFAFDDICEVMGQVMTANVLVISRKGKIVGHFRNDEGYGLSELIPDEKGELIDASLAGRFLDILSTKENVSLTTLGFSEETSKRYEAIISPIIISGDRLGTMVIYRRSERFDIEDIILAEYGTAVVGLELLRSINEEEAYELRQQQIAKSAAASLSVSEIDAVRNILDELKTREGIIIASKVADKAGITRSVIVNALRKLESAGIIESRSSGMKGTFIRILNDAIYESIGAGESRLSSS